ncbi:type II toxin-antitoxin system RelE/ParE family toxin, partial [Escherichia coli]
KQDMSNINSQELAGFRELAKHYAFLTKAQLTAMINTKELTEICYDCKN